MVNIVLGTHHHLKGRDELAAGSAVPRHAEEPQIVSAAEDEIGLRVQGGAHFPQSAVAAGALQAVLMPVLVQGLQKIPVLDLSVAASTTFRLGVWLD